MLGLFQFSSSRIQTRHYSAFDLTTMPPIIPAPTPIKGIRSPDGTARLGKRLPLAELQKNDFAFALYTQALLAWQKDGDKIKDADSATGTSYFQVTGMTAHTGSQHILINDCRHSWCPLRSVAE